VLFWKRKVMLFKSEVTPGIDPVPTAGANAVLVRNVRLSPLEQEGEDRDFDVNYVGHKGRIIAGAFQTLSCEVELAGAGAAGTVPGYGPLLKACAASETISAGVSVTYAPVNPGGETSGTFYLYIGGRLHKATYAVGNVKAVLNRGKIPVYQFEFTGLYITPTDVALPAPTLTAFQKPLAVTNVNTTPVTLHGFSGKFAEMSLDAGNQVVYRNLVGSESVRFIDRSSTASVKLEAELMGAIDWHTKIRSGTLGALSVQHGITAGNIVVLAAPNAQPVEPSLDQDQQIGMKTMKLLLTPSSAGNDEWSIVVK
jgi:hypothetical protein